MKRVRRRQLLRIAFRKGEKEEERKRAKRHDKRDRKNQKRNARQIEYTFLSRNSKEEKRERKHHSTLILSFSLPFYRDVDRYVWVGRPMSSE